MNVLVLDEAVMTKKDIYYNKDKFDSGEINLCFITGYSGSGKSTMGSKMDKDFISLDDVIRHYNFTDDNLKKYNDMLYNFFTTKGKKWRDPEKKPHDNKKLINEFIDYAISYAKTHKNKKYVIEGVWLFVCDVPPEKLKDYAVCIKMTGAVKSAYRAGKRDYSYKKSIKDGLKQFKSSVKFSVRDGAKFNNYVRYFTKLSKEDEAWR
jgi:hypothetical protein